VVKVVIRNKLIR